MKKVFGVIILLFLLAFFLPSDAEAWRRPASGIHTDTTNFGTNLSSTDNTVQTALETLDDLSTGVGDITSVGDCTSGAAFDGTSDGGTYLDFYDNGGAQRFKWDASADDFDFANDINISDATPHLQFKPTSGDAFEIYAYENEIYCVNVTDGKVLWRGREDNLFQMYDKYSFVDAIPTDNYILKWDAALGYANWEADAGAAGGDAWGDAVDSDILPTGNDNTYDLDSAAASFAEGHFDSDVTLTDNLNMSDDKGAEWGTDETLVFNGTTDDFNFSNDALFSDTDPWIGFEDTTDNTGYLWHYDSGATYPFALFYGTFSSKAFSKSGYPLMDSDDTNVFFRKGSVTVRKDLNATGLYTKGFAIENLAAADDNYEFYIAEVPITITKIGLHCRGTCTTPAQISLEDRAGNAMTHDTPIASTGSDNTSFVNVTANNSLVIGEGLRFDVDNSPSPESDEYMMIFSYTVDAQ